MAGKKIKKHIREKAFLIKSLASNSLAKRAGIFLRITVLLTTWFSQSGMGPLPINHHGGENEKEINI